MIARSNISVDAQSLQFNSATHFAWVILTLLDSEGRSCEPADAAFGVVAVSVHEDAPSELEERLSLMERVVADTRSRLPAGVPVLWIYPAGFFHLSRSSPCGTQVLQHSLKAMRARLHAIHGENGWVLFGVDEDLGETREKGREQHAVLLTLGSDAHERVFTRGPMPTVHNRTVQLGPILVALFVCGEIGSIEEADFDTFRGCRLVVDLAHSRVPGTKWSSSPSPRMLHETRLNKFRDHATLVLVHHHGGKITRHGTPDSRHMSNWLWCRNELDWKLFDDVLPIARGGNVSRNELHPSL